MQTAIRIRADYTVAALLRQAILGHRAETGKDSLIHNPPQANATAV
jgi:hypothetical protein